MSKQNDFEDQDLTACAVCGKVGPCDCAEKSTPQQLPQKNKYRQATSHYRSIRTYDLSLPTYY